MKLKLKPQTIILFFVICWLVFIVWGIVRTTSRLSTSKVAQVAKKTQPKQKEVSSLQERLKGLKEAIVPEKRKDSEKETTQKSPRPEEIQAPPILVRTFQVKHSDFSDVLPVMGAVKGNTEIELRFEINGIIQSINFREGEKVKKNDLVCSLNPHDARLKVQYAKNRLASAKASYDANLKKLEIHRKLYAAGAIIKSKLEEIELECQSIKFQVETAKAEERLAKNELKKTKLSAPIDGVMGPREAEEGELVTPQDKVASLLETADVLIEVGIVERDINKVQLGQKATVFVDAYPNLAFEGVLDNIFPTVEGRSRTMTAKIKVHNPQGLLLPGMFSRAEISIIELHDALIIPSISLVPTDKETTLVPVIPAESLQTADETAKMGRIELRPVTLGYITSDYVEILEGLNEGDLVVTEAQGEITDKAQVRITTIEQPSF